MKNVLAKDNRKFLDQLTPVKLERAYRQFSQRCIAIQAEYVKFYAIQGDSFLCFTERMSIFEKELRELTKRVDELADPHYEERQRCKQRLTNLICRIAEKSGFTVEKIVRH